MNRSGRLVLTAVLGLAGAATGQTPAGPAGAPGAVVRYDGQVVVRARVHTVQDVEFLEAFTGDIWSHHAGPGGTIDVRVRAADLPAIDARGIAYDVLIPDLQALHEASRAEIERRRAQRDLTWFENYKTYDEINAEMAAMAAEHPGLVTPFIVGNSLQGRAVRGIKISSGGSATKPAVIFNGTQHAREWVSPMTVMFLADQFLTRYATDQRVRAAVDLVDIHLVPVSNPDGYVYSWTTDRYWRKNRRNVGGGCFGVDLNRNWGYEWGGEGSSGSCSSETYRGAAPFSEPETQILRDYIQGNLRFEAHIDFHSYSQLILYPWGYTSDLPPDAALFDALSAMMADEIAAVHGMSYDYGPSYTTIYPAAGVMPDWTYGSEGMLGWTIELRDTGATGFELPPEQIIPTGQENFDAVLALVEAIGLPLKYDFPAGLPGVVAPGVPTTFDFVVQDAREDLDPASVRFMYRPAGARPWALTTPESLGGGAFRATLPAAACGSAWEFHFFARSQDGSVVRYPWTGADDPLRADVLVASVTFADDMETNKGWTVGATGDNATTGVWNRMNPEATAAQPENDHTAAPGVTCWITDGRAGSSVGTYDVDGGTTTVTSPTFSATGGEAYVGYFRWYSNNQGGSPNEDTMPVEISNNNGSTWTSLELVGENAGAWVGKTFRIADFVTPTSTMRVRFRARDLGDGSIVEAGVDDFSVTVYGCGAMRGDFDGDGERSHADLAAFLAAIASGDRRADLDADGATGAADLAAFLAAWTTR